MPPERKSKGPWIHRFAIRFFTVVLTILVFWLLGFLVDDIRSIPGPKYDEVEARHLDAGHIEQQAEFARRIADLSRDIANQTETQRLLGDSSRSLQQTIAQLIELQKAGIEKSVALSEAEQANFTNSLNLFLENQRKYQESSQAVADLIAAKQALEAEKAAGERLIESRRRPAQEEFQRLMGRHRLKMAFFQLAILLPILAFAAVLFLKKRTSLYFPLFLAFGAATLIKVALVVHEYFPTRYFKYVLIIALILVVVRLMIHVIRIVAFPKAQWLIKQYREAYERFLCPVCEYPIRTGPRRFLYWTRHTVNRVVVPNEKANDEEPYACPSCGSRLFEECPACHKVRHALLPHCSHCGAEKAVG